MAKQIARDILDYEPVCVVIEDFILGFGGEGKVGKSSDKSGLSAVRMGHNVAMGLDFLGYEGPIVWQTPSQKAVITDERLKSRGLYDRKSGAHVRDAVRHLEVLRRSGNRHSGMA